jgi:hypothetical protein
MLESTIFTSPSVGVPIAFGSTQYFNAIQNVGRVKSFVDDLNVKRGTVSMRVAFVLRSAEVQPLFRDLCIPLECRSSPLLPNPPPPPNKGGGRREKGRLACYAQNGRHDGAGPSEVRQQASPSCLIGGFGKLVFFSFCSIRSRLPLMAPKKPWSLVKNNKQQSTYCAPSTQH